MIIPGYGFVSKIKNNIIFGIKWNMKFITNVLRQNVPVRQKSYNSAYFSFNAIYFYKTVNVPALRL